MTNKLSSGIRFVRFEGHMSAFRKLCEELSNYESGVDSIRISESESKDSIYASSELLRNTKEGLVSLQEPVAQFRRRAEERNDDRKYYGPNMVTKVLEMADLYDRLCGRCDELLAVAAPFLSAFEEQERLAAAEKKAEVRTPACFFLFF